MSEEIVGTVYTTTAFNQVDVFVNECNIIVNIDNESVVFLMIPARDSYISSVLELSDYTLNTCYTSIKVRYVI